ncbi:unnamed protein product [Lactuca saligna]|uniref:Reverse transcriptase Ty1/copia-type domain-containing protein n=1 Tax=Lactuca saligna TaxID=75948 RepID=A0AA35VQW5_LACSI|nr:unnamed protein product [Lactuca saligna]
MKCVPELGVTTDLLDDNLEGDIWKTQLKSALTRIEFRRLKVDHGCCLTNFSSSYIILVLNVDVMLNVSFDTQKIIKLKIRLTKKFKIKNQWVAKMKKVLSIMNSTDESTKNLERVSAKVWLCWEFEVL